MQTAYIRRADPYTKKIHYFVSKLLTHSGWQTSGKNGLVRYIRHSTLGRTVSMQYDLADRLTWRQDAKGQVTSFSFDVRNLETGRQYMDGTRLTFGYDRLGNRILAQDRTGSYTFSFDLLDRPLANNAPSHLNGAPFTRLYDPNGNLTQLQTGWGTFSMGYDARDQVSTVVDPGVPSASIPGGTTTLAYEPRMLLSRQDNPNGTHSTLTYDAARHTTQIRHATAAGVEIEHAYYSYDGAGRPLTRDAQTGRATWGYDTRDRLTTESGPSGLTTWLYDQASRRSWQIAPAATTTYAFDAADQLLTSTTAAQITSFLYDRNGSATAIETPAGAFTTYAWDAANCLASTVLPSGSRTTQLYRFDDLRIAQSGPHGVQTFTWAEGEVLAEQGKTVTVSWQEVFTHKPGESPSLLRALGTNSAGTNLQRQYHLDALGSVQAITGSSQAVETAYRTDAWGSSEMAGLRIGDTDCRGIRAIRGAAAGGCHRQVRDCS